MDTENRHDAPRDPDGICVTQEPSGFISVSGERAAGGIVYRARLAGYRAREIPVIIGQVRRALDGLEAATAPALQAPPAPEPPEAEVTT